MPIKLSILILNYKTKGLLKQCLRGIQDCKLPMSHEVIVVDNHSQDGSVEMVKTHFPRVSMVAARHNRGFAAGMNIGLSRASGEFVMTLNTDVAIFSGAIDALLAYVESHPQVGMALPKLINPDGTTQLSCFRFPTAMVPIYRRTFLGTTPHAQSIIRHYLMSDWDHKDNRPVGWGLGACLLIRRTAIEQAGLFDERFFLYYEDADLCRRFWQRGWEVHFVASAEMVHYHQRLSAEHHGLRSLFDYPTRIHIQSAIKYFAKYLGAAKPPHHL